MSVHVSSWAWSQTLDDDGAKLVLLKLADSANDHGISFPAKDRVLEECEIGHDDTWKRRLRKLRELELAIPVPWFGLDGRQTYSTYFLPWQGVPSAERLWKSIEQAARKGATSLTRDELLAAESVGAFLRSGGAIVHPLNLAGGGADAPPRGGTDAPPIENVWLNVLEEPDGSSLPDESGGGATRLDLMRAFGAARGVDLGTLPKRERRQWELAADDLVEIGATAADVLARWAVWPWDGEVTPLGIVGHWSLLGTKIEAAKSGGFDGWLADTVPLLGREASHDVINDMPGLDESERARRHLLVDERLDDNERSNAA